jgi:hypothetical protein
MMPQELLVILPDWVAVIAMLFLDREYGFQSEGWNADIQINQMANDK